MNNNPNIRFISYIKAISVLLVVLIHFFCAFFNSPSWSFVARMPEIELSYPKVVVWINSFSFDGLAGFLVSGAVSLFFLASGFTTLGSVEKREFLPFWKVKLRRLFPFYSVILFIDLLIAFVASILYKTEFHHSFLDLILQLLMGLQFFVPHAPILDPVIWFLAVDLVFWFLASVFLRPIFGKCKFLIFDISVVLMITLVAFLSRIDEANGVCIFTSENYNFLIKSLTLCLFILLGTMFADRMRGGGTSYLHILVQFLVFIIIYRIYIIQIGYLGIDIYIPWYVCYFIIFWLFFLLNDNFSDSRLLNYLSDISFSLYFCHGYMGYFITVSLMLLGLSKGVSALVGVFCVLIEATLLHKYLEKR